MFGLGTTEIIIIAAVLVLLFGPRTITTLGRSIGEAVGSIRGVFSEAEKEAEKKGNDQ